MTEEGAAGYSGYQLRSRQGVPLFEGTLPENTRRRTRDRAEEGSEIVVENVYETVDETTTTGSSSSSSESEDKFRHGPELMDLDRTLESLRYHQQQGSKSDQKKLKLVLKRYLKPSGQKRFKISHGKGAIPAIPKQKEKATPFRVRQANGEQEAAASDGRVVPPNTPQPQVPPTPPILQAPILQPPLLNPPILQPVSVAQPVTTQPMFGPPVNTMSTGSGGAGGAIPKNPFGGYRERNDSDSDEDNQRRERRRKRQNRNGGHSGNTGGSAGAGGGDWRPPPANTSSAQNSLRGSVHSIPNIPGQGGLIEMFTHLGKPINTLLDPELSRNPEQLARGRLHLEQIKPSSVDNAVRQEKAYKEVVEVVRGLMRTVHLHDVSIRNLSSEPHMRVLAHINKASRVSPNPPESYPTLDAPDDVYIKSIGQLNLGLKTLEKHIAFKETPYNFALAVACESNSIASNFGLSKIQQLHLILSALPRTSTVYQEIFLFNNNLEAVFDFLSTNSSTLLTKSDIESKIEAWSLNTADMDKLAETVGNLKILFLQIQNKPVEEVDQRQLYLQIVMRIRRERLPSFILRNLEEARILIENETDPLRLFSTLMSAIRPIVGIKLRGGSNHNFSSGNGNYSKKIERENSKRNNEPKKTRKVDRGRSESRNRDKDSNGRKNNNNKPDRGRSYGRNKSRYVQPWPQGKPYRNSSGNKLTRELEEHFRGFCFRCGIAGHNANNCRIYSDKTPVLTLCDICNSGFHRQCKNKKYTDSGNDSSAPSSRHTSTPAPSSRSQSGSSTEVYSE